MNYYCYINQQQELQLKTRIIIASMKNNVQHEIITTMEVQDIRLCMCTIAHQYMMIYGNNVNKQ